MTSPTRQNLNKCLWEAVERADVNAVRNLLHQGADVECATGDSRERGLSVLMLACRTGSKEVVDLLVKKGADVQRTNEGGCTPLHFAAKCGHDDIVNVLLQHNANPDVQDKDGKYPHEYLFGQQRQQVFADRRRRRNLPLLRTGRVKPQSVKGCILGHARDVKMFFRAINGPLNSTHGINVKVNCGQSGCLKLYNMSSQSISHIRKSAVFSSVLSLLVYVANMDHALSVMEDDAIYWLNFVYSGRSLDDPRPVVILLGSRGECVYEYIQAKLEVLAEKLHERFEGRFIFQGNVMVVDLGQRHSTEMDAVTQLLVTGARTCLQTAPDVPLVCDQVCENVLPRLCNDGSTSVIESVSCSRFPTIDKAAFCNVVLSECIVQDPEMVGPLLDYLEDYGEIRTDGDRVIINTQFVCQSHIVMKCIMASQDNKEAENTEAAINAKRNDTATLSKDCVASFRQELAPAVSSSTAADVLREKMGFVDWISEEYILPNPASIGECSLNTMWRKPEPTAHEVQGMVYCGIRFQGQSSYDFFSPVVMPLLQHEAAQLQHEMLVTKWDEGMLVERICAAGQPNVESVLYINDKVRGVSAFDVIVRGPAHCHGDVKQFRDKLQQMFMQIVDRKSPGTQVQKRYLSYHHVKQHIENPLSYSQEEVDAARKADGVLTAATATKTVHDSVVDLLAVEEDHVIYKLQPLSKRCSRYWLEFGRVLLANTTDQLRELTACLMNRSDKFCLVVQTWIKAEWRTATCHTFLAACDRLGGVIKENVKESLGLTSYHHAVQPVYYADSSLGDRQSETTLRHSVGGGKRKACISVQRDGEETPRALADLLTVVCQTRCDGGEQYYTFQLRLDTFRRWPSWAGAKADDLAREGFYYTGIRDEVRCFKCEQLLRLWRPEENIRERHRRYSPNCPFLAGLEEAVPGRVSPPAGLFQPSHISSTTSYSQTSRPFDDMRFEDKRLKTYRGFPAFCPVQPAELARAGFYFTGKEDGVQCFSCHVALRGWERGDTAEGEHRRHNPFCPFLNGNDTSNVPIQGYGLSPGVGQTSQVQPSPALRFEHNRLRTFDNWPGIAYMSSQDLAEAGFYYVGERDAVRCFHCLVQIEQWVPGEVPVDEHLKHSPDCSYAKAVARRKQQYESYSTPNAQATAERMKSYEQRMVSFRGWPSTSPVSPESLALAGFYYSGSGDGVRCFSCGGALRGWEEGDTAWGEHERYFPSCDFVQQQRSAVPQSYDEPWRQPIATQEPTTWPLDSTSVNISDFIQQATSMGFAENLARRIIEGHDTSRLDFDTYLDSLLRTQAEEEKASLTTTSHGSAESTIPAPALNLVSPGTPTMLEPTAPPQTEDIRRELEQIQESRLCKVCLEREAVMLYLPCAHIVCCEICARDILKCPVCRVPVQNKIRSYFA